MQITITQTLVVTIKADCQLRNISIPDPKTITIDNVEHNIESIVSEITSAIGTTDKYEYQEVPFIGNICKSDNCRHRRKCAQHETAGDFRSEDGLTPKLKRDGGRNGVTYCQSYNMPDSDCDESGMLVWNNAAGRFELYEDQD